MLNNLRLHETTRQDKLAVLYRQWSGCSISGKFATVVRIESRKREWLLQISHSLFKPTNTEVTNISHTHVLKDKTRSQIHTTYIFLQLLTCHYKNKRKLDTLDGQSWFMEYIHPSNGAWLLKTVLIVLPETSVQDYHSALRQTPKQRKSHLHRGESLKLRKWHVSNACVVLYHIPTVDVFRAIKSVRNIRDTLLRLALLGGLYNASK
jgi:hypothetical protein